MQFNLNDISHHQTLNGNYLWPNEVTTFQDYQNNEILLIPDGFLLPGQNDGGIYAMINSIHYCKPIRITKKKSGWFYHRAIHVTLPCGQQGILTARAHKPLFQKGKGELIWISIPHNFTSIIFSDKNKDMH